MNALLLLANILLVVVDDVGVEALSMYNLGNAPANTPTLEMLSNEGVLFTQYRTSPVCTPSRVCILTGQYPFRHGMGGIVRQGDFVIAPADLDLPSKLRATGLATGAFGKWHMSDNNTWPASPYLAGFDSFFCAKANLGKGGHDYSNWVLNENGVEITSQVYATSQNVEHCLEMVRQSGGWFAYIAFNTGHRPFHTPPAPLHTVQGLDPNGWPGGLADPRPYWLAMVEAMDTELGRLLAGIDLTETTVVVVGDNGSGGRVMDLPFNSRRDKGTLYEGGIRAPLIIAGAAVANRGRVVTDLVQAEDVYATIVDLAGIRDDRDGVSMRPYIEDRAATPLRRYSYIEFFTPNGQPPYRTGSQAITDGRWKLIVGDELEFYDLLLDPYENDDILGGGPLLYDHSTKIDELRTALLEIRPF